MLRCAQRAEHAVEATLSTRFASLPGRESCQEVCERCGETWPHGAVAVGKGTLGEEEKLQ